MVEVKGEGMNTPSLFERAKQLADGDPDGYAHVWVVYDKDSFSSSDFNATAESCKNESYADRTFHAAWTNEAFELWYLLHFEYLQSALSRDMYQRRLSKYLKDINKGPYRKNNPSMYSTLEPMIDTAIANAKKLEVLNANNTPSESNPGTKVHMILEHFLPFLK